MFAKVFFLEVAQSNLLIIFMCLLWRTGRREKKLLAGLQQTGTDAVQFLVTSLGWVVVIRFLSL